VASSFVVAGHGLGLVGSAVGGEREHPSDVGVGGVAEAREDVADLAQGQWDQAPVGCLSLGDGPFPRSES
jgi:hypothetical protein